MSRHDPMVTFAQMRDHAQEAIEFASGRSFEDMQNDRILQLALVHLVEVVGEAATRIPEPLRLTHPTVPWRQIIGTRNRLIHGYDRINLRIVWEVIADDLPVLTAEVEKILNDAGWES